MMTTGLEVLASVEDGVGMIRFNRPEVSNSVRPSTMQAFCEAFDVLSTDTAVRALVITGNGRHFVAGADFAFLRALAEQPSERGYGDIYAWFQGATRRIWRCPKPVVAAVNGAAITVGCEIALMSDIRIVTGDTRFQESWIKLGLITPLGGSVVLPRLIGLGLATEMILEGRVIKGDEAVRIGLASALVAPQDLLEAAKRRALAMASLPAGAFRAAKEALHRGLESSLETEWQANVSMQGLLLTSQDFRDRVAALPSG